MQILSSTNTSQNKMIIAAIKVLSEAGIIIYPTETVYGMGVDALNQDAVDKLLSFKEKREDKPLSIAVCDKTMADTYASINETGEDLYKNFLPGPVTVVSIGKHKTAKGVESLSGTIGIRIPNHPLVLQIIKAFSKPITATSANASYKKRPYQVSDILENISKRQSELIDLILDIGELPHNDPSTVVDTTHNDLQILRQGEVTLTDYEVFYSHSVEETILFARSLIEKYEKKIGKSAVIFALQAEMGVGKTHFAKGIGKALDILETIASPSYTLEEEYDFIHNGNKNKFIHIDTWRIMGREEYDELDIANLLNQNPVIVIEWAEKVTNSIKEYKQAATIIWIKMNIEENDVRKIMYSESFFT